MDLLGNLRQDPESEVETVPLAPVARQERIVLLDVLRGIAVLGIFLINMPLYVAPGSAFFNWEEVLLWPERNERLATLFLHIFAQGKFYTLFSLLFGLGFGLQMQRAAERNSPGFLPFYRRRLFVLLGIGIIHFTLIWWGDVLHIYALLGFVLLLFRGQSGKTLLIWAASLTLVPLFVLLVGTAYQSWKDPETPAQRQTKKEERVKAIAEDTRVNATGTVPAILQFRLQRDFKRLGSEVGWAVELFATFLVGLWVSRQRILQEPSKYRPLLNRLAFVALPLGMAVTAGDLIYGYLHPGIPNPLWRTHLSLYREFVARPAMGLGYAAVILLVGYREWMKPLAAVGRMALTNYLMHSVVFTTVANAYGLGLYGKIPPSIGLALSFGFFGLQIPFSVWWLRHHKQGPMEQLWRSWSYRNPAP